MENPIAQTKNTSKARKFNLEDTTVELLGEKSGLVIFKFVKAADSIEYYSLEEEAFDKYFEFKFILKSLPKIDADLWTAIKSAIKKFN
jgi:hypothetical protein